MAREKLARDFSLFCFLLTPLPSSLILYYTAFKKKFDQLLSPKSQKRENKPRFDVVFFLRSILIRKLRDETLFIEFQASASPVGRNLGWQGERHLPYLVVSLPLARPAPMGSH